MVSVKLSRVFQNSTKVDEIQGTYRGMTIACEPDNWSFIQALSLSQLADFLLDLAARVNLKSFLKQPRSPKKKKPPGNCELTSSSSFYSKAFRPGSAVTLTGLARHSPPHNQIQALLNQGMKKIS